MDYNGEPYVRFAEMQERATVATFLLGFSGEWRVIHEYLLLQLIT